MSYPVVELRVVVKEQRQQRVTKCERQGDIAPDCAHQRCPDGNEDDELVRDARHLG